MLTRLSLRARLILGVITLAAVGLLVTDIVTYSSLRSFEIGRTDSSLEAAHIAVEGALFRGPQGGPGRDNPPPGDGAPRISALTAAARGDCVELLHLNGTLVSAGCAPQFTGGRQPAAPRLPESIEIPAGAAGQDRVSYLTVPAKTGGDRYRVRASIEPSAPNYILVIAQPLTGVDSTLHRLLLIELLATGGVLLGIGLLGLWVVRLGLRPLDAIGKTAADIAAGQLSERVERAEERTEVGKLGLALNAMLSNIEAAVKERDDSLRALEASESKLRRFVADASHELRTPLAAVRAYAELFTRGAADRPADLERSMTGITRESERMSVLVEDLLLLAHLDEGRPLAREPVALEELVGDAVETARMLEPERPVEVSLVPSLVDGDRDRLRQVIDNLLSNVRSHTPPDAPLRVSLAHVDGSAEIAVSDSGAGLEQDQLDQIFERFYRADASRARTSGGVGLGLAIVAAVVGAQSGTVTAESAPGQGTTFRVRLPLAESEQRAGQ